MRTINEIGNRYGLLTVVDRGETYISPKGRRMARWLCKCDCGKSIEVLGLALRRGDTKSCGCLKLNSGKKRRTTCKYDMSREYGVGYTSNTNKPFYFDKEDFEIIKDKCWFENDQGYIVSTDREKSGHVRLHRLILGADEGEIVDHINCNKKDNRKSNLRYASRQTNGINRPCNKNNKLKVKGVSLNKDKYDARIMVDGKNINLGRYENIFDAIDARKIAEQLYFGEFAYRGENE